MRLGLFLGVLLRRFIGRISIHLAGRLILGELELFFDLALATGQLLITLLTLKVRADFGFIAF